MVAMLLNRYPGRSNVTVLGQDSPEAVRIINLIDIDYIRHELASGSIDYQVCIDP